MGKCFYCSSESVTISSKIGVCVKCLRKGLGLDKIRETHRSIRRKFGLTLQTPRFNNGIKCRVCGRGCSLLNGVYGYCSVRSIDRGVMKTTTSFNSIVGTYYYDPHPTNCVAFPVCPAITGKGYPKYALSRSGEKGYYNIAVFPGVCNLNCLYCQNWEFKLMTRESRPVLTMDKLVNAVNEWTTCICYFGGDPSPYSTFFIEASRKILYRAEEIGLKTFRICWETNGLWDENLFLKAIDLSLESGGIVKIDFKAWSYEVYEALTGAEPEHVDKIRKNIARVVERAGERGEPPLLVISTLLVPGYVDEYEIDAMTRFVSDLDSNTPYVFLAFHPEFELTDLPRTSRRHAEKAVEIARKNGLKNVYLGNQWLLSDLY